MILCFRNLKSAHKVEKYVQSRGDVSPVVVDEEEPEGETLCRVSSLNVV